MESLEQELHFVTGKDFMAPFHRIKEGRVLLIRLKKGRLITYRIDELANTSRMTLPGSPVERSLVVLKTQTATVRSRFGISIL